MQSRRRFWSPSQTEIILILQRCRFYIFYSIFFFFIWKKLTKFVFNNYLNCLIISIYRKTVWILGKFKKLVDEFYSEIFGHATSVADFFWFYFLVVTRKIFKFVPICTLKELAERHPKIKDFLRENLNL